MLGDKGKIGFELDPRLLPLARSIFAYGIEKTADRYDVLIKPPKRHRSTGPGSQGHHLNGHIMQIAQETGNDFADIKLYLKRRAFRMGLPYLTKPDGSVVYSLVDGEPMPISETEMTPQECGWVIDEAHILAAELGIALREE